jgi:phosphoribosylamine--glycine ligase
LRSLAGPWVVKTDGLAAGKGVLVADDLDEAVADMRAKLSGATFGAAGRTVVVEEGLSGPEVSVLAVCDGRASDDGVVVLPVARDHKRLGDGDTGPNTGGMGAFSPVEGVPDDLPDQVLERMVLPTLHALRADGVDYRGVLYAGIMLTADGPKLLEYNVRFGDPEAQVVLPRLDGDVAALLDSAAAGRVDPTSVSVRPDACVGVVLAAPGYPAAPVSDAAITGLEEAGPLAFCAGVAERDGDLVTAGGRVACVAALGPDVPAARKAAYAAADRITFEGGILRREDIAATA